MKAVILAGGKGRRLRPYTTVFPKPLMPIGDRPIMEIVLRQLKHHGINEALIAVGHLPELIMTFFGNGEQIGLDITYSRENQPLGTAGCLGLLKSSLDDTFLMMNGDVLTSLDYTDFIRYHRQSGAVATVALKKREVAIDFGIVEMDGERRITGYHEKPVSCRLVCM